MSSQKLLRRAARLAPADKIHKTTSSIKRFVQTAMRQISGNEKCRFAFLRLIDVIELQTTLLAPELIDHPAGQGQLQSVLRVCRNLAEYAPRWLRDPETWTAMPVNKAVPMSNAVPMSVRQTFHGLIHHLLVKDTKNPIPRFMFECWFQAMEGGTMNQHYLFLHVASGHSIRGTSYGAKLDRNMTKKLLTLPADTPFFKAAEIVRGVTPPTAPLEFPPATSRRRRKRQRFKRYREKDIVWEAARIRDFYFALPKSKAKDDERTWIIRQLTSRKDLRLEGRRLRHCVSSYVDVCVEGRSAIFTMESRDLFRTRAVLTIEVEPKRRIVCQIKGFKNRNPRPNELEVIRKWANREDLKMTNW